MSEKVIRFPRQDRKRNEVGEGYVECYISNRWLNFIGSSEVASGNILHCVDIMTTNDEGIDRKLSRMVISKSDLLRAMEHAENIK